jgi:hypothetical protein
MDYLVIVIEDRLFITYRLNRDNDFDKDIIDCI